MPKPIMLMKNRYNISSGAADKFCNLCGYERDKPGCFMGFHPETGSPMHTANCSNARCENHTDCGGGDHNFGPWISKWFSISAYQVCEDCGHKEGLPRY